MIIEARAYARAGFLGNPSDGYFGKTISISVKNFGAHIVLYESPELKIEPSEAEQNTYRNMFALVEQIHQNGYYGADRLIKAAIKKFVEYSLAEGISLESKNFTIRYHTNIPRQVGLAGSSAIITATMRALMKFYQVAIPKVILPSLILKAETEELGINAGLQDRVIQVYEGCVFMDFNRAFLQKHGYGKYSSLIPNPVLPHLYLAYKTKLSKISGTVLNAIRVRYEQGDKRVHKILTEIASLAQKGKAYIEDGNIDALNQLIDRNFDLRSQIMPISDENMELVTVARQCGASAKFAGSGGSIIGLYKDNETLMRLIVELKKIKARVIKPFIY